MVRFQCIHCGGRIAVPDDHMDRVARCPDCGGVTHPLAQHLVGPGGANPTINSKTAPPAKVADSVCDNCGGPLGKLQKPFEWDGHFVCGPCHRMLSLDQNPATPEPATAISVRKPDETFSSRDSAMPIMVVDGVRPKPLPSEFTLIVRTACIGLIITAGALYLIVNILQSLGYLIMWGAVAVMILAAIFWIRRGVIAIHRRATMRDSREI